MSERGQRKVRVGRVVSNAMKKTVVIAVDRQVRHPLYGRYIRRTTTLMAHDEDQTCQVGDVVRVMETRPLSKLKRWRFVEVVKRAEQV
ncbi:MAG: 30S ribosomal protein S17 [Candidatus Latescibacteria bacterium]|nr:30S ribosomal protein S17 [Candidatus Latescibacterota bacterium]